MRGLGSRSETFFSLNGPDFGGISGGAVGVGELTSPGAVWAPMVAAASVFFCKIVGIFALHVDLPANKNRTNQNNGKERTGI